MRTRAQVMGFWRKAERVVAYKQQSAVQARKKEAMDKHLSFLVDQTSKYSSLLAQRLAGPPGEEPALPATAETGPALPPPLPADGRDSAAADARGDAAAAPAIKAGEQAGGHAGAEEAAGGHAGAEPMQTDEQQDAGKGPAELHAAGAEQAPRAPGPAMDLSLDTGEQQQAPLLTAQAALAAGGEVDDEDEEQAGDAVGHAEALGPGAPVLDDDGEDFRAASGSDEDDEATLEEEEV